MSSSVGSATAGPTSRSRGGALVTPVVLAAGTVVSASLSIMVVPLLTDISQALHAEPTSVSWALIAGQLSGAALTPLLGRLGDLVGHRRVLLALFAVMALGSLIAGLAHSLPVLIVGRTLQGAGTAATVLGVAFVRQALPEDQHHRAIGIISCGAGVGVGVGFILGGLLHDWHGAFWLALGGSVLLGGLTAAFVPDVEGSAAHDPAGVLRSLDVLGAAIFAGGLVSLLLPISQGSRWGWTATSTLALFAGAIVLLTAFAVWELRCAKPLVDLRVLGRTPVLLTNMTSLLFGICLGAGFLLWVGFAKTPPELGYGFGDDALHAGFFLLPNAVAVLIVAPLAGAAAKRWSPGVVLMAGTALGVLTFAVLSSGHEEKWQLYVGSAAWGSCVAMGMVSLFLLVREAVPAAQAGSANSITALGQSVGSAAGSAIFTAVLNAKYIPKTPVPAASGYTHAFVVAALFSAGALVTATAAIWAARSHRGLVTASASVAQLP